MGHLLLCLQKSANLCYSHTDPTSFYPLHTITTGTPQSLLLQPHIPGMKSQPHLTQSHVYSCLQSRLPLSLKYLLPSAPKPSLKFLCWYMPSSCCWLIVFSLVSKIQETSLEWSRLTLSVVVAFLYSQLKKSQRKPLLFVFFLPHHSNFVASKLFPYLIKGIGLYFLLNFKLVNL